MGYKTFAVLFFLGMSGLAISADADKVGNCVVKTFNFPKPLNDIGFVFGDAELIKRGYTLVSGGCVHRDWKAGDQSMFLGSYPTNDNQWMCWFKNPRATTIEGHAKYCKLR